MRVLLNLLITMTLLGSTKGWAQERPYNLASDEEVQRMLREQARVPGAQLTLVTGIAHLLARAEECRPIAGALRCSVSSPTERVERCRAYAMQLWSRHVADLVRVNGPVQALVTHTVRCPGMSVTAYGVAIPSSFSVSQVPEGGGDPTWGVTVEWRCEEG